MYFLLLSTLPQTREARAHYDALLSLKHERRAVPATLAHKLHSIAAALLGKRSAAKRKSFDLYPFKGE
ncbi:hypothetical protein [Paraburkholderia azotifigens]|uniref:Uncharacterized protein n=2 Tax=Paraburkholderia azotifigens TaxID=2057004 RepID=A0A5C6VGB0_9BURK|nr:hypothetical protein [Paraburkholderia azotifigens]TXC83919.1 hypothetical protein FRZ40_26630 [Paraburkholderia azotifigens]